MDLEKAQELDDILKRFAGDKSIFWDEIREKYKDEVNEESGDYPKEYYLLENNIKYLLGDNALEEFNMQMGLRWTDSGWAKYTDPDQYGYVAAVKAEMAKETTARRRHIATLVLNWGVVALAAASVIIQLFGNNQSDRIQALEARQLRLQEKNDALLSRQADLHGQVKYLEQSNQELTKTISGMTVKSSQETTPPTEADESSVE